MQRWLTWVLVLVIFTSSSLSAEYNQPSNRINEVYRCLSPNNTHLAMRATLAVAFFGMSRSLNYTLPSIQKRIFDVLDRDGIAYDVFWHTMVTHDHNHARFNPFEVERLRPVPCKLTLEDQEAVQQQYILKYLKIRNSSEADTLVDPFNNSFLSLRNLLGSYHTQIELAEMIRVHQQRSGLQYTAVLAIRPDTAMFKEIDISEHLAEISSDRKKIWVPDFQHWYGGVNDRAAFGSPDAMFIYLRRGLHYRDSGYVGIGETHLQQYLAENLISVAPSKMRFVRVRADGSLPIAEGKIKGKHKFIVIYNLPHDDPDLHKCVDFKRHKFKRSC